MSLAPVLLFTYNRSSELKKTLVALKNNKDSKKEVERHQDSLDFKHQ